jgi:general secretion pathway protein G
VAPSVQGVRIRAQNAAAATDIKIMQAELAVYIFENREPPVSLAVIGRASTLDPWGIPYVYTVITSPGSARKDRFLVPLNSDYDLYSMGLDGESSLPLSPPVSHDDVLRALDGAFVGLAADF